MQPLLPCSHHLSLLCLFIHSLLLRIFQSSPPPVLSAGLALTRVIEHIILLIRRRCEVMAVALLHIQWFPCVCVCMYVCRVHIHLNNSVAYAGIHGPSNCNIVCMAVLFLFCSRSCRSNCSVANMIVNVDPCLQIAPPLCSRTWNY